MYKRNIENKFLSWLDRDEILIVTGSRQVWKSSFMKSIQRKLKQKNIFFNLEDFDILQTFDETPKNLIKILDEKFWLEEKIYVFIDEIQYLKKPSQFLKYIYDEYKNSIKLIVSGSSAFYIDEKFDDSLAGRKKIFYLRPLDFKEFLIFKDEERLWEKIIEFDELTNITKNKIYKYLEEFLIFWWYPKVVLERDKEIKKELIWEIVNSYLKKDILESKIEMPEKFFKLYKILSNQSWKLINAKELSNTLDISTTSINRYLHVLKKTFHFYEVKPFFQNIRKEITKMPKFYIQDLWIKNYFEKNFNKIEYRVDSGSIFETLVFHEIIGKTHLDSINFWRTQDKKEIDFIIDKIPYEVKLRYDWKRINVIEYFKRKYFEEWRVITLKKADNSKYLQLYPWEV